MGCLVGGIFGTLMGCAFTYKTGNMLYIPISAVTSGGSFGFFLGIGTVVRNGEAQVYDEEFLWWKIQLKLY